MFDIKPSSYGTTAYQVDSFGVPQTMYLWTDCGGEGWDTPDVWVNVDTNEIIEDVPLGVGDALFIQGTANTDTFLSSGQVCTDDAKVFLCNGGTLVGNPYPVDIKVNDIIASTYGTTLYKVDSFGIPQTMYLYTDCGGEGWDTPDVWVVADTNEFISDEILIEAGQGIFVQATDTKDYIELPAPEL